MRMRRFLRLLFEKGANVTAQGVHHENALRAALIRCNAKTLRILLENGDGFDE